MVKDPGQLPRAIKRWLDNISSGHERLSFFFLLTPVKIETAFYNVGMNEVKTMKCDYTNDLSISRASLADRDTDDLSLATFS